MRHSIWVLSILLCAFGTTVGSKAKATTYITDVEIIDGQKPWDGFGFVVGSFVEFFYLTDQGEADNGSSTSYYTEEQYIFDAYGADLESLFTVFEGNASALIECSGAPCYPIYPVYEALLEGEFDPSNARRTYFDILEGSLATQAFDPSTCTESCLPNLVGYLILSVSNPNATESVIRIEVGQSIDTAVPLPGAALLFLTGLTGASFSWRRHNRRA